MRVRVSHACPVPMSLGRDGLTHHPDLVGVDNVTARWRCGECGQRWGIEVRVSAGRLGSAHAWRRRSFVRRKRAAV